MADTPLAKRLRIKPGHRVLILNAPDGYAETLGPLPDDVELAISPGGTFDCVHLFVKEKTQLDRIAPTILKSVKPDGLLWISWPKRSSRVKTDITRDTGWEAITGSGWDGIATVSVDETWSAIRFRPREQVKRSPNSRRLAANSQ